MISIDFCHVDTILISTRRHFRETARSKKNGDNIWQQTWGRQETQRKLATHVNQIFCRPKVAADKLRDKI